jgi:hypothetical protein
MQLPQINGKLNHNNFFIYGACDTAYFDEFGKVLVNSIRKNSNNAIHLHLFNPRDDQLEFCYSKDVSVTYEYVGSSLFVNSAKRWSTQPTDPLEKLKYDRILNAMSKSDDATILDRMQRTYFACARFIRLAEIIQKNNSVFSIDVDAIVRKSILPLENNCDVYLHHITGKKARFLAGGVHLTGSEQSHNFITDYAKILTDNIANDYIYWGLDQDVLDIIVPKYKFNNLPFSFIDWEMGLDSHIWTAKGTRKNLEVFINEKKKYSF